MTAMPSICTLGVDGAQCCSASDCPNTGDICVNFNCVSSGSLRFTVSWFGDDDMDIHVITPGGVEIYYANRFDPVSGGQLDFDRIPSSPTFNVENIAFSTPPPGEYDFFVDQFSQRGGVSDVWTLVANRDGTDVFSQTGVGDSIRFSLTVSA